MKCKRSFDPDDDRKTILLHPVLKLVVYRGYTNTKNLPDGNGIQYRSKMSSRNKKLVSLDGTDYYVGYKLRAGNWRNGKMCGNGYQYFANGLLYMGEFLDDRAHGKGTFYKKNKIDQTGTWRNGNIWDGYGTIFYDDGGRYKGYAINGLKNGIGITYDKKGNELKCGNWINDNFVLNPNINNES
jgi:hypothetical protein